MSSNNPLDQTTKIKNPSPSEKTQPQQVSIQAPADVNSPQLSQADKASEPASNTEQIAPPSTSERIKRDFSFAQVLASVFSTVTCMLLAPKIGVLGGILGAAIGAAVAAGATQIYKSILYSTSDKIRFKQRKLQLKVKKDAEKVKSKQIDSQGVVHPPTLTGQMKVMAEESLLNTLDVAANATQEPPSSTLPTTPDSSQASSDTPEEKPYISQALKYILIIAGVTMLSVAISVGLITYLTKGEGLGKKPEVVYITKYVPSNDSEPKAPSQDSTKDSQNKEDQKAADSSAASQDTSATKDQSNTGENTTQAKPSDQQQSDSKQNDANKNDSADNKESKDEGDSQQKNAQSDLSAKGTRSGQK